MGDDPRRNLKWLEQALLEEERPQGFSSETEELLQKVDALMAEEAPRENPAGNFSSRSKGARAERSHIRQQFDESAAVLTKTKKQLRQDAKRRKKAEKKASVNHNIKGLVFLAVLEVLGILAILGWWLQ